MNMMQLSISITFEVLFSLLMAFKLNLNSVQIIY